jgi:hypothetical protein
MKLSLRKARSLAARAVVFGVLASPALGQTPADSNTAAAPATPPPQTASSPSLNVSKLPINLSRLQRRLRTSAERSQQDGTNLKVFVDVYAFAPPLVLFTRGDILGDGAVPGGPNRHQEMIDLSTPTEHRGSNTVRKGGINILGGRKK